MKQKKLNDILYVFDVTPYEITEDTDAEVIKVQEEVISGFKELNESLADKIVAYNYHVICANTPEWAEYVDEPEPGPQGAQGPQGDAEPESKADPELAWSSDAEAATIGGDNNLIPTLSNPHSVTVTYSSSDTEKATIDESTGEITLVSEGETTISAIFAGDDTYEAQTVTYTLSVEAAVAEEEEPTTYYYTMYATNDPSDTTATDTGTFTSDNSVARTEDLGDSDVDFVAFEITSSTAEPQLEGETLYANYEVMDYIDTTTRFQLYADVDGTLTVNEGYVVISTTDPAQNL